MRKELQWMDGLALSLSRAQEKKTYLAYRPPLTDTCSFREMPRLVLCNCS